jgi:hypothetical protein
VILVNLVILLTAKAVNTKIESDFMAYILNYDILEDKDASLTLTYSFTVIGPQIERIQMLVVLLLLFATFGYQFTENFTLYQRVTKPKPVTPAQQSMMDLGKQSLPCLATADPAITPV